MDDIYYIFIDDIYVYINIMLFLYVLYIYFYILLLNYERLLVPSS